MRSGGLPRRTAAASRSSATRNRAGAASWLTPRDSPLVAAGLAAYRDLFDRKGETVVWDFSTNGTATAGIHAIPTIGIGPGDPRGAHLRDERVSLRQCVEAAALYAAIPARFVRGEGR